MAPKVQNKIRRHTKHKRQQKQQNKRSKQTRPINMTLS